METLAEAVKRIQKNHASTNQNSFTQDKKYECPICKDTEWIIDVETNTARPCKCREAKLYKKILQSSGISEAFRQKSFSNFSIKGKPLVIAQAKKMSINYISKFSDMRNTENNSIAFLGQVGCGKTHLSIAIANELMKRNIGVRYMQYREDIVRIKQCANDEENYSKEINKYKTAAVLLIDDLFKKATYKTRTGIEVLNDADARAMFEIINYRYLTKLPMIISSEYSAMKILDFDEAIGSRIIERCKGNIMELKGQELNYRLN